MSIEKVYLELTNRCNLNCEMCYRKTWQQEAMDMDEQVLEKCLREIKTIPSVKEVVLGGIGEPTFAGKTREVMETLKNYELTLTTNGTIMDEVMLDSMVDAVNHMIISIDGTAEIFHEIRQFSLEKIIENIKALNELKQKRGSSTPVVSFQMVISDKNKESVFEVLDLAASLNVSSVIISHMLPTVLEDEKEVLYTRYENKEIKELFQKLQSYAVKKGIGLKLPAYELKTERRCRFIESQAAVITDSGDITSCYRFAHDGGEVVFGRCKNISAHSFGNISEKSLKEVWESKAYTSFRNAVFNNHYPSCVDCDLVDGCDMVRGADVDCYSNEPSCGDCLWSRKLIYCV